MAKSIAGSILLEASGFRPIASIALSPISPIARAGIIPPSAIINPPEIENSISKAHPPSPLEALQSRAKWGLLLWGYGGQCPLLALTNLYKYPF